MVWYNYNSCRVKIVHVYELRWSSWKAAAIMYSVRDVCALYMSDIWSNSFDRCRDDVRNIYYKFWIIKK